MNKKRIGKLQSLSILLPVILVAFSTIVGFILYTIDISTKQTSFPKQFTANKLSESILIRSSVYEWLKRGEIGMAQSIIEKHHAIRDIIGIVIIDSSQKTLVATQYPWVHLPLNSKELKLSNDAYAVLLSNMNISLRVNADVFFFSPDHKKLLILLPILLSNKEKGTMISCYDFYTAEQGMIAKYRNTGILYLLVLLSSSIVLGIILYYIIIARLHKLIRAMDTFSKGDYDVRIASKGVGEISLLYAQFNRLATALKAEITGRIRIENALKEKTSNLLKAQRMSKVGEWKYDIENKTLFLSDQIAEIGNSNRKIYSFSDYFRMIHPEDRQLILNEFTKAVLNKNEYTFNYRLIVKGNIQYFTSIADIGRDETGKAIYIFGVSRDITTHKIEEMALLERELELKKSNEEYLIINAELSDMNNKILAMNEDLKLAKERAEESDRLKSAFLANVSHEIRTPMNAIIGFSDLLDDETLDSETRKLFTHTIKTRSADLLHIINDILDISRLESGSLKVDAIPGSVSQILNELISYYNTKNKNITKKPIIFNLRNSLPPDQDHIITDINRLKQILMNLIDNAFKFTSEGLIEIGCSAKDEKTLLFYVKDTGIGIPKVKLEIIFERFRQATDAYLSNKFGGTGLGLAISKGLIELMKGDIRVQSEEGKGTVFFFTIPLKLNNHFTNSLNNKNQSVLE